jgi:hypothetical protein
MTLDDFNKIRPLTVDQVAKLCLCSKDTVYANIKRDPSSRYYLRAYQNTNNGPLIIYPRDFEDFRQRTQVGKEKAA